MRCKHCGESHYRKGARVRSKQRYSMQDREVELAKKQPEVARA